MLQSLQYMDISTDARIFAIYGHFHECSNLCNKWTYPQVLPIQFPSSILQFDIQDSNIIPECPLPVHSPVIFDPCELILLMSLG